MRRFTTAPNGGVLYCAGKVGTCGWEKVYCVEPERSGCDLGPNLMTNFMAGFLANIGTTDTYTLRRGCFMQI